MQEEDGVHQRARLSAEEVRIFCSVCQVSAFTNTWLSVYGFSELGYSSVNPI